MGIDRRKFITIAGLTAAAAVSKKTLGDSLSVEQPTTISLPEENALIGHRWAMVIDTRKCLKEDGIEANF